MKKLNYKKIALNSFALTLFVWGLLYITRMKDYVDLYDPLPGRTLLLYLTAFVDISIASSILMNVHVNKVCTWGGYYWLFISVVTFLLQIFRYSNIDEVNSAILTFISAIGYTSAILFIGYSEDES